MTGPGSIPRPTWDTPTADARARLAATIGRWERRVAGLGARLGQNPPNSSRPPSTDPPGLKRKPPVPAGRRERGARPGHPGARRAVVPPEKIAPVAPCKPPTRRRRHHPPRGDDPGPPARRVAGRPAVEPAVHGYRRRRPRRPGRGETTRGVLPRGVPAGSFGPRPRATPGPLAGAYRLRERRVRQPAGDLLGPRIAAGMTAEPERRPAATPGAPVERWRGSVAEAPVAHVDETSRRQGRGKARPGVAATARATAFTVAEARGAPVARTPPGAERPRATVGGRFPGWGRIAAGDRRACRAHPRRDFRAMVDRGGVPGPIGRESLDASNRPFRRWHRARGGTPERSAFVRPAGRVKARVISSPTRGRRRGRGRAEGTCTGSRKLESRRVPG